MAIPTDPSFNQQWHLLSTAQNPGIIGLDLNVVKAWDRYSGKGVSVGIVDSGVQYNHSDLNTNYNRNIDFDGNDNDDDPQPLNPQADNPQGTEVAGIIAADANNSTGGAGVAFDATLASFRRSLNPTPASDAELLRRQVNVDVSNNSWGEPRLFVDNFAAPEWQPVSQAIDNATALGRNGLGTVFVFAAGDDLNTGNNSNYHNLSNSRYTIAVGALNENGQQAPLSAPGSNLLVSAPAGETGSIFTTTFNDLYTNTFGGTQAAAAMVSGVAALMLEANPNLGYRDVQEILAYSAVKNDPTDPGWRFSGADNWNGGGLHINEKYGYGLVDAYAAVQLAKTWQLTSIRPNEQLISVTTSPNQAIPDNNANGLTSRVLVPSNLRLDHVEVDLDIDHTLINDLTVTLTSPDGIESVLLDRPPETSFNLSGTDIGFKGDTLQFTFSSTRYWGESGDGAWTLKVVDNQAKDAGVLKNWTLRLYGDANADDTYIYTNELSSFNTAADRGRRQLKDSAGVDTLNASLFTSNLVLNLTPGSNSILSGQQINIDPNTMIENAFAGTGNDRITGNDASNILGGDQGNDLINGGSGNDQINGEEGDDDLNGDDGNDTMKGGIGDDIIRGGLGDNILEGNDGNDRLTVAGGSNFIRGNQGQDIIQGNFGNDTIYGGKGPDVIVADTGQDYLSGDTGSDTLVGGGDLDVFQLGGFGLPLNLIGIDTLNDFSEEDRIALSKSSFAALSDPGTPISFAPLVVFEETQIAPQTILYDPNTGSLYYNPDGEISGLQGGGLIARLPGGLELTPTNFFIIA